MIKILIGLFVKNKENTEQPQVRQAYGVLASVVGILCNIILFAAKIIIGTLINSISITADAINNLSDAGSSIISFIGVKLAGRPADKEHPFGHGRIEYISALIVAFIILDVGFTLLQDSFQKILHPEDLGFNWVMVLILLFSVGLKVWLALFNRTIGIKINSSILKATSADARNDVIVTSTTIVSVLIGKFLGLNIDGWMGLMVSVFVLISGFNIAKDTLVPLLGEAVDHEIYEKITQKVISYPGIIGSHDLIVHNYGPSHIMATIHAEVPNNANIDEIHEVIDQIERDALREMDLFLVIHMDPIEINDEKVLEEKKLVLEVVGRLDSNANIHDFRIVKMEKRTNLIFDLVVPYSYSKKEKEDLCKKITDEFHHINDSYQCVITIENSYIAD